MATFNKKTHLRQNIEALRTAFTLDGQNRLFTDNEWNTLTSYSGFGGIKEILDPLPTGDQDPNSIKGMILELHELLRQNSKDEREYKNYVESAKSSVLTAFYTPQKIIETIAKSLWKTGVKPMRILDPSAGTGAFARAFNMHSRQEMVNFEKDLLTGKVLQQLRGHNENRIAGFENIEQKYNGYFDLAASNIPFGDVRVFDPLYSLSKDPVQRRATSAVHNYFFLKGVDCVREGGLVAFITSQGVLNAESNRPVREWLMDRCQPISVIRFPNNLFAENAGTEVGSDLIILQKDTSQKEKSQRQIDFIETRKLSNGISINNIFQNFDRVIHTEHKIDTDQYGKPAIIFTHSGGEKGIAYDLAKMLGEDFSQHLNLEYYQKNEQNAPVQALATEPTPQDIAEYAEHAAAQERKLYEEHPPQPADFAKTDDPATHNNFDYTLYNKDDWRERMWNEQRAREQAAAQQARQVQPTSEAESAINQAPLISLYDLFGMSAEERSQIKRPRHHNKKHSPAQRASLFGAPATMPQGDTKPIGEPAPPAPAPARDEAKEREEYMKPIPFRAELLPHYREGSLVSDENNRIGYLRNIDGLQPMFHPLDITEAQERKASVYVEIRDTYYHLYQNEADRLEPNPALREMLNRLYDDFTGRYGLLNDKRNLDLIKMDARGTEILSLERYIDGAAHKAVRRQAPPPSLDAGADCPRKHPRLRRPTHIGVPYKVCISLDYCNGVERISPNAVLLLCEKSQSYVEAITQNPIRYYGGQQRSLKHILPLIPEHELYNEPFAGGASVFFAKEPAKLNVLNDINGELMNFYRTVVTNFVELNIEILKTLHSREQHKLAQFIHQNPTYFSNVKRAWAVWVLSNMGFAGQLNGSYGYCKTKGDSMTRKILNGKNQFCEEMRDLLEQCNIENDHAFNVIKRYDSERAFHFLAPPYVDTNMGHYGGLFSSNDLLEMLDILVDIKGKFMLMMYPNNDIQRYADANGWTIHVIERTLPASHSKKRIQEEWIVVNY